ncbi:Putative penicillin-binding protein PbpX [Gemmata sp. SH-PL17]|uniref:serine hydrolase n=1 Tax=Gemmata sp. SH-PL17 TaxID=1630693 RepID=UPI00078C73C8|nr:serine hydrolase [Gemmata sp. SH-PL17]AMV24135.1 Putative penicillin-binding protein PbpX [Gemmata sp. SH-PL17]
MGRYLLLCALVFVAPSLRAAEFDPKPIDEAVTKALKEFDAPGASVVIVKGGQVIYLKGFGVRAKGKEDKVTPDTVFPIASCSKAFTATALAMLAEDGKLKWDDKVHDHLDYFRLSDELADREVTLRDLLCHRTGMPRHDALWSGLSTDGGDVIRRWGRATPSTSFRSKWEYANVPFTTAGVIAGKLDGSDWASVIKNRIFKPLGMERSSCTWKEGSAPPDHATAHYYGFDKSVTAIGWDEIDHAGGAGCINSTARDMGSWLQFQLAGGKFDGRRLITERALKETHTSQMLFIPQDPFIVYFPPKVTRFTSYGLGWFVHDYRGANCVSHGGTLTGFRAQCMLVPEKKIGVFVLCNLRPSYVCESVCKTALDALLELPAEDWVTFYKSQLKRLDFVVASAKEKRTASRKPDTKPSLPLKDYAGAFEERAYGRAEVIYENDKLMIRWGKYTFRVEHYHFDTFTAIPVEPKDDVISFDRSTFDVQFRLGTNGEVQSMRFFDQEFRRAKK